MPSDVNLGVRSPKGLLPLRFPIAHDHVVILKFNSPFRIITGHKLGASRLRMAPEGLFKACPPAACTIARPDLPARFGTPVDLRSTPIRECGFAATCRAALTTPGGASLTTFGFVTIVPRYLLPQVMPSHSFAARTRAYCAPHKRSWKPTNACQCQPPRAPRRGIGVRTRQRHLAARACCAPRKWRFGLNYTVMALPTNQCLPVPAAARPRRA